MFLLLYLLSVIVTMRCVIVSINLYLSISVESSITVESVHRARHN